MGQFPRLNLSLILALTTLALVVFSAVVFRDSSTISIITMVLGNLIAMALVAATTLQTRRAYQREIYAEVERQRFSVLVQNTGDLIAISGPDRVLQYLNNAGRDMVGVSRDVPAIGLRGTQFYSAEFNHKMETEVIPAVLANGTYSGEFCYQNFVTKESIPVFMNIFLLMDPVSKKNLGMAAVSRDLRDRKKLERQLDRFFEVSLDMLGIANTAGYFLKLNPAFTEILGYTEAELCARPCTDFIHPDDIASTLQQIEAQAGGKSVLSFENRYRTKSGDYRWFSWKSSPDGELTYGAARDITEEKNQQVRMMELSQQAIAASQAKSEFLANMSHEIRTPINGVIGMTSLLLDSELNPQQLDYAGNIKDSAESLLTVINDILDFSKIEAGKLDIEKVDFDLATVVDQTAKSMSWAMRNKSIPFIVNYDHSTTNFYRGDPGRIRQVLNNLLSNAIKFTETGSIRLEVQATQIGSAATAFRFSVKDSGIGISPEAQAKLFQSFSQADASTARKFGGTGLGLSISKRLVDLMGGEIGLESAPSEGSRFWFTLTLDHALGFSEKTKPATLLRKTKYPHAQILVAEDNFVNQKILLAMLAKIGFNAQAVGDGHEVLSILHERNFDLILMDCQMPGLDGYSTTEKIRASKSLAHKDIPIIALTANALKGDREKCIEAGMNDYASKPISSDALSQLVETWLEKIERRRSAS